MKIVEVGPRDGLQNEAAAVPTEVKIAFIDGSLRRFEPVNRRAREAGLACLGGLLNPFLTEQRRTMPPADAPACKACRYERGPDCCRQPEPR